MSAAELVAEAKRLERGEIKVCRKGHVIAGTNAKRGSNNRVECRTCVRARQALSRQRLRGTRTFPKPGGKTKERSRDKRLAASAVSAAKRRGILVPPTECSLCHSGTDVQAHHDDYGRPLDVRWLCRKCHMAAHRKHTQSNELVGRYAPTHCPHGHTYSGPNLRIEQNGHRHCRACDAAKDAARRKSFDALAGGEKEKEL